MSTCIALALCVVCGGKTKPCISTGPPCNHNATVWTWTRSHALLCEDSTRGNKRNSSSTSCLSAVLADRIDLTREGRGLAADCQTVLAVCVYFGASVCLGDLLFDIRRCRSGLRWYAVIYHTWDRRMHEQNKQIYHVRTSFLTTSRGGGSIWISFTAC